MVISEQCVSDPNEVQGREVDLTPGSPLILTHRIRLVPGSASGSCCQAEFGALRERIETLEREVSELREKCGGLDGGCCTSQQSKGVGCSTDQCLNDCSDQGRCVDGKCVCFPGFSGPDCSVSNCPGDCSNKGKCVNGKCVCDSALIAVSHLSTRNITESSVTLFWTPPVVQYNSYLVTFTSERCQSTCNACLRIGGGNRSTRRKPPRHGENMQTATHTWQRQESNPQPWRTTKMHNFVIYALQKESDQKITTTVNGRISAYTQVGLAPGQRYTVTIIGEKDGKMGAKSTTTFQTLISGPKNLEVVKTSTTSVIVQWEEAQGEIDRYVLSISPNQTDSSGKGSQEIRLPPGRDSAQIDSLEPGRLYDISLVAVKDGTQSLPATVQATPESGKDNILPNITNREQDLSRITNRDQHMSTVTGDQDLPSNTNRDDNITMTQVIDQNVPSQTFSSEENIPNQNLRPKFTVRNSGRFQPKPYDQIKQNSTTIQSGLTATDPRAEKVSKETTEFTDLAIDVVSEADPLRTINREFNNNGQNAPTPNFTATMRRNNGTVFRHKPKPKIKPNLQGDPKQSTGSNTTRTTSPQNTINRNSRPNIALKRKSGTTIRPPPKVFPQLRPNSTTVHEGTGGSKNSRDDPKLHWATEIPLSTDKATSQRNTTFSPVSEDSINQVGFQNVTSKGFIIIWVAPEGRFKNFVIRIIEEIDEGVNEGDGNKQDKRKERTEGNEITANVNDVRSSNNGVRKKFIKLLPGSARSYPVTDLTSQTNYSVTLYGTSPGLRSNIHTFIITTGPEPPSHLSFSDITDTSLSVSWRRPKSSVSGFKVTYIHTKEGEPISVTVDSSSSTLSLTKLSPGSPYEVSVISVLGLDESDATKDMVITSPDAPTDLRAINITDSKALLVWRPALATVDQYIITYHSEEAPGSELSISVSGNAAEQQLQTLKASTKYRITIISQLGDQKSSSTHTAFTTTSGSPGKGDPPQDLTAKHVTARTASLSWKPPASAVTSYKLTYFTKGGERKEVTLNPGVAEHKLKGLHPSSTYMALLQGERGGVYMAAISTEFTTETLHFPYPSDCSQELMNGELVSGLVKIFPRGKDGQPVMVYCDMETDGGGWTVFQRRKDGKTNFFRGWQEYRKGFGDLKEEFWLGNDFLHYLTTMTPMNMRVDLRSENDSVYAHYSTFSVDTMKKHYMLRLSGYSGTAGDSLRYHDKRPFSTYDRDPQPFITRCAMSYRGGWWYKNCHEANLNGQYNTHTNHQGVIWTAWKGKTFSIPFTEMKLRPASFRPHSQG
ncbi:hypothetical protein QTP86_031370 [Hemibagrus guttatus]|nr:hypothetical protein QTP86_031370 [Hemibagrus guttatus]